MKKFPSLISQNLFWNQSLVNSNFSTFIKVLLILFFVSSFLGMLHIYAPTYKKYLIFVRAEIIICPMFSLSFLFTSHKKPKIKQKPVFSSFPCREEQSCYPVLRCEWTLLGRTSRKTLKRRTDLASLNIFALFPLNFPFSLSETWTHCWKMELPP